MLPPFSYSNQYIQLCKPGIILNTATFLLFRSTPKSRLFHILNISRICPVFSFSTVIICFQAPIISFLNNYVTFYWPHLINSRLHISSPQKKLSLAFCCHQEEQNNQSPEHGLRSAVTCTTSTLPV